MATNMANVIYNIFKANSKRIFLLDPSTEKSYTYLDFYNLIMNFSDNISSVIKVKDNTRVLLYIDNSIYFSVVYFWSFFNGIKVFPVSKKTPTNQINGIISEYQISEVISDESLSKIGVPSFNVNYISLRGVKYSLKSMPSIDYNKPVLFLLTSGSTGKSKCVAHSLLNFINNSSKFIKMHRINKDDRFVTILEMSYMAGFYNMFFLPFIAQASIVIRPPFSARDIFTFWSTLNKIKVNILWLVPSIIKTLNHLDRDEKSPGCCQLMKCVFSCTANLNLTDKKNFYSKYNKAVYNTYGLSETLFISSENNNFHHNIDNYVGQPLSEIFIDNDHVKIKSNGVFEGYYIPSLGGVSKEGVFDTGDIGFINEKGLFIIGRGKDIIIKGGVNINPVVLENKIRMLDFIEDVCVAGMQDDFFGEIPVCALVVNGDSGIDHIKKVKEFLSENISKDNTIDSFIILDLMPLNYNNKVDKFKVVEFFSKS